MDSKHRVARVRGVVSHAIATFLRDEHLPDLTGAEVLQAMALEAAVRGSKYRQDGPEAARQIGGYTPEALAAMLPALSGLQVAAAALIHLDEAELDRLKAGVVKQAWKVARNRGITCTTRADRGVLQAESDIIAAAAFEALLTLLDEHAVQVERMGR